MKIKHLSLKVLKISNLIKLSFVFLGLFFIAFSSSFTKKEIEESYSVEEVVCQDCEVTLTQGNPCTVCITCADASQRIEIEDGDGNLIFFLNPKVGIEDCFTLLNGRTIHVKQFGCPTQIPIDLGEHTCI